MIQDNNELEIVKKMKNDLKPKLYWPIWTTIICSGPLLNLIFRYFIERDIKNPTAAVILTVIGMVWTILNWYWYVKDTNNFKKNWGKISAELHTLNLQEMPSKEIIDTIFDKLMITVIASLVMFFVFAAIVILGKLTFLKYFMLFCILIFLIAGGGLIIIGIIQLFSLIRIVIKCGRLKKVLKKFIIIYALSFFIVTIISFIIHKNPEWIKSIFNSLMITLPIFLSTEVVMFYKKIKQEYSLNSKREDD